jgi:(p)ppGpp synthase/HD superfamily hydrolase
MKPLSQIAEEYAIKCHSDTNHLYDGLPYSFHLELAVKVAKKFIHLIPERNREIVLAACWCHDTIEDTRVTPNDVVKATNKDVALIVYAVTNEKGWTRKDRANDKYYKGIRDTKYATFVKLCDRIANALYSQSKIGVSTMFEKYKEENLHFTKELFDEKGSYGEMFDYLEEIFAEQKHIQDI